MAAIRHEGAGAGDTGGVVTLQALLGLLRRRAIIVVAITVLVLAAAGAAAYLLPQRYAAEALLVYEPSAAAEDDPGYAVDTGVANELAAIGEIVYSRDLLERVIREHVLLPSTGTAIPKQALEQVRSRIGIRAEGESTFSISFEDDRPERVAQVVAELATALVGTSREQRAGRAQDRTGFLEEQLEPLVSTLKQKEQEIESYKSRWASEMPEQAPTNLRLLEGVQDRLLEASSAISDNEARRAAITREMSELERQGLTTRKDPAQQRLEELRGELGRLRMRYTDRHPDVLHLESQVADLEQAIEHGQAVSSGPAEPSPVQLRYVELDAELEAVEQRLASARSERQALLQESQGYQGRIGAALHHEAVVAAMGSETEATRSQVQTLREQLQEAEIARRLSVTEQGAMFRIAEWPRVPTAPVSPNRTRILLMGLVAGLGLGGVAAFARDQLDSSFRTVGEVEEATGLPVLAGIPLHGRRLRGRSAPTAAALPLVQEPNGPAAEQFRMLAARVSRRQGTTGSTATLVTGALSGEGKTTVAVNLSIALAEMTGEEVLLVDADVARSSAYRFLGVARGNGLAALMAHPDGDPAEHARWRYGISLLEVGPYSMATRTALASPRGERAFQRLRQRYRHVVVDSPPVLGAPEALLLQTMVDGILLVVRAGSTPRDVVLRTSQSLDATRLIGVVLNGADGAQVYAYSYLQPSPSDRRRASSEGRLA